MAVTIPFESEAFDKAYSVPASGPLEVTWGDLVWAALTIGRPPTYFAEVKESARVYEWLFRIYLLKMALTQWGAMGPLHRTDTFNGMDPTEKGAVNYFLGMMFCNLFAERLLLIPDTYHIDAYRKHFGIVVRGGRSRPDLVGQSVDGKWHAFESKGRGSPPDATAKRRAKEQASLLVRVGNTSCSLHVGAITYFEGGTLKFFWRDPPGKGEPFQLPEPGTLRRLHYEPFMDLIGRDARLSEARRAPPGFDGESISLEDLDVTITFHPAVAEALREEDWQRAHEEARRHWRELRGEGFHLDGVRVVAGSSWLKRRVESGG